MRGLHDFLHGGDPAWRLRRWAMFWSMVLNWSFMIGSAVSASFGRMPVDLAQTIVTSGFALTTIVLPGYFFSATWDDNSKRTAGATVVETTTAEGGPPPSVTVTTETIPSPNAPAGKAG